MWSKKVYFQNSLCLYTVVETKYDIINRTIETNKRPIENIISKLSIVPTVNCNKANTNPNILKAKPILHNIMISDFSVPKIRVKGYTITARHKTIPIPRNKKLKNNIVKKNETNRLTM